MKLYIVLAAWPVTKNNHAGMYYLAKKLQTNLNVPVKIFKLPVWNLGYLYPLYRIYAYLLGMYIRIISNKDDIVWLMEYLLKTTEQSGIAKILRGKVRLLGIAHLVPDIIDKQYTNNKIKKNIELLDKLYVFGSSLKKFLVSKSVNADKIKVTFHYVDTEYYKPNIKKETNRISVICMGNMQRDYKSLHAIIEKCPGTNFIICSGRHNIKHYFDQMKNVQIIGYVSENELKELMQSSHISLNVMKDTIGSNVIVSSMACGLPIIASNVGSICDYVENDLNGYLFDTPDEAATIINSISNHPEKLHILSQGARIKAEKISLKEFIAFFKKDNNLN